MIDDNYISCILGNASAYSSTARKKLIQSFIQAGIALPGEGTSLLDNVVVLGNVDEKNRLIHCMKESGEAIKIVEEYEFIKAYKYSYVYGYIGEVNAETIQQLIIDKVLVQFDVKMLDIFDPIFENNNKTASIIEQGNEIKIKVSFPYVFYDNSNTDNRKERKFIVLAVIHKDTNLIEFRYDSAPAVSYSSDFYFDKVCSVKYWLATILHIDFDTAAMEAGVDYIKDNESAVKKNNIFIIGKYLEFGNGSSAELKVGKSDSMVLPLIGELKNLLSEYSEEFDQVPNFKNVFENLIQEWDQNSQTPCLYLMWKENDKEYCQVKIDLKHLAKDGCRLLFYAKNHIDGEGMSHVVNYIGSCQAANQSTATDGRGNA